MKRDKRRNNSLLLITVAVFLLGSVCTPAGEIDEHVQESKAGIVRICSTLTDGTRRVIKEQTGFLIGNDNGAAYVISEYQGLSFSREEIDEYRGLWYQENLVTMITGVEVDEEGNETPVYENDPNVEIQDISYEIIQNKDVHTQVELYRSSEQLDLAIFSIQGGFDASLALTLESEEQMEQDELDNPLQEIYLLAFPRGDDSTGAVLYSQENVYIFGAQLQHKYEEGETTLYRYDLITDDYCNGAPLLNARGNVVAIQTRSVTEGTRDAVSVLELRSILDENRISYKSHELIKEEEKKISKAVWILGGIDVLMLFLLIFRQIRFIGRKNNLKRGMAPGSTETLGQVEARLYRPSTGEGIPISSSPFHLGSRQDRVQYCIPNNARISRVHACITRRKGHYYLVDLNSSNGTVLMGMRLQPEKEYELKDGMRFQLFDEEFVFQGGK